MFQMFISAKLCLVLVTEWRERCDYCKQLKFLFIKSSIFSSETRSGVSDDSLYT